jgi:hypothetical protein
MSALMPNSSGVYPNSVRGFNASIANQSAPRPDAFGSFGTDPITGGSYTDKASAQAALGQYANPNSNASRYLRSMQPTMLPGGGGGGGGGGGRMGPREPRKKIMRMGARTASEYTAEQGGLSPQRPSTLDAAYQSGALTSGFKPAQQAPGMLNNGATPMEQGGGYNLAPDAFDKPAQFTERVTPPNEPTELVNRAKGGAMKIGQKPYLVGEEGPELIMPRANGDGYVLPADVTQQLLPMMTQRPTPRNVGGPITMETRGGTFRGFEGTSSSGQPAMGFASNIPTAMMTPDALARAIGDRSPEVPDDLLYAPAAIARAQGDRVFVDPMEGRYQLDPNQPGMPLMPDVVSGPWAEPGMPAPPREQMRSQIGQSLESLNRMPGVRTAPTGQYPGETFSDTAQLAMIKYGNNMPANNEQQTQARLAQYDQADRDPFLNAPNQNLTFEELRDRVALRGMMYGDDYRDRQNRDRVQQDLANRAARAPIGTPTMLPGQGSEARIQANLARQMERLSRTPEGAMLLAKQQQDMDMLTQRSRLASTAIPVKDAEGNILGYTTGTGASLPNIRPQQSMTAEEAEQYGLQPVGTYSDGSIKYGRPPAPRATRFELITGRYDDDGPLPDQLFDPYTGEKWNHGDPIPPAVTAARGGTASSSPQAAPTGPVAATTKADYDRLPSGTRYTAPDGKVYTKK